jgi:hypothetical protein
MISWLLFNARSIDCSSSFWLEIKINNKKYLYGTFYIPPNSGQQIWEELEQSIDLALNSNHDIIITGVWSNKGGPTSEYNILWGLFTNTRSNRDELRSVTYVGSVIS